MNIGKAISFIFDDPDWWKKLLIGMLISLIPLIGWFVIAGWRLEIIKRVAKNDPEPLPSFDNFGDLLTNGAKSFLVTLVYQSPMIILGIIATVIFVTPFIMDPNIADDTVALLVIFLLCGWLICIPIMLGLTLVEKSAQMELAVKGKLSDAFSFRDVFDLVKLTWGQMLLAFLAIFIATVVLQPVGSAIILVGTLVVSILLSAFKSHLYGQLYTMAKGAPEPQPEVVIDPDVVTM